MRTIIYCSVYKIDEKMEAGLDGALRAVDMVVDSV